MRIAVIAPIPRAGTTSSVLLVSYALARTQALRTLLTYTGTNVSISKYVGRQEQEDRTRSISQVCKLLEAHAIAPSGISDYCTRMGTNLELLDSASPAITNEERTNLLRFVFENAVHDVIFCDISGGLYDEDSQQIFDACDMVIVVSDCDFYSLDTVHQWRAKGGCPKDKPVMLLINNYNPEVMAVREAATRAGFKVRDTCKIHYNPFIRKLCNKEELDSILPYILAKDPRVIELHKDLEECVQCITSYMGIKCNKQWEV